MQRCSATVQVSARCDNERVDRSSRLKKFVNAVAKNDDEVCNPFLGDDDILGIIIGVSLTLISLGYAGWSATADEKLSGRR